ncbi:glycoside hydrolase [Chaetomium fimeti]|uniref:lytic cellulose monooxygenase (C4-dehydrogenating) n=1 Tax=Chaetomium fimeti TaxID=1854472 RepID=A0AAE0HJG6_9PEZI|nr:glycoside hydrolase [Chaetomium fimeti]
MLISFAAAVVALAHHASAHATVFHVSVNGKDQGDGVDKYIRSPGNNEPITDLADPALVCNVKGGTEVGSSVKAAAGDKLTFHWWHYNPDDPNDFPLDDSHKGAVLTWIANYTSSDPTGPIWSKLAEEGFEGGKWATMKLIEKKGAVEFSLPKALAKGKYLIRQEIIALHKADGPGGDPATDRGAEFYPSCAQFEISGDGGKVPDQDFDFNKDYKYDDKGLFFNLYIPFDKYTPPGPRPWKG